jgi:hypothetical protein
MDLFVMELALAFAWEVVMAQKKEAKESHKVQLIVLDVQVRVKQLV